MNLFFQILTIIIIFVIPQDANAQIQFYESYEDYVSETGPVYDDYVDYDITRRGFFMDLTRNEQEERIRVKGYWGFKYKDAVFRFVSGKYLVVRLMSLGKVAYYENGFAHLCNVKRQEESTHYCRSVNNGVCCYISEGINTEIFRMVLTRSNYQADRRAVKKFWSLHPELSALLECCRANYRFKNVRKCIDNFEN